MPSLNYSTTEVKDRARGCFLGLFVGDALGTTLEFSSRDSLPEQLEITGGGPFRLRRGDWTDGGSMALALAESLLSCRGLDRRMTLEHWLAWYRHGQFSSNKAKGCFDIGNTIRQALEAYESTGTLQAQNAGRGNGGIMRLAPVVTASHSCSGKLTVDLAVTQSGLTHGSAEAARCARDMARLCHGLVRGKLGRADLTSVTPRARRWVDLCRHEVSSSGLASHTLEAALWCVYGTDSFQDALTLAVNLGDDSDTVGAVTGQVAGALYGASAIPGKWSKAVKHWRRLSSCADDLIALDLCKSQAHARG